MGFLSLLSLVLAAQVGAHPTFGPLAGVVCLGLLIGGRWWMLLRLRVPGTPTLTVDAHGLTYVRGSQRRALRWDEIAEIQIRNRQGELRFVPAGGTRPVTTHYDMIGRDGSSFTALIDHYWSSPGTQA